MSRYRRKAGQILLEILYGIGPHIDRTEGIEINITKMAQAMNMRPVRLLEALSWLSEQDLLVTLEVSRYTAKVAYKIPEPCTETIYNVSPMDFHCPDEWIEQFQEEITAIAVKSKYGW